MPAGPSEEPGKGVPARLIRSQFRRGRTQSIGAKASLCVRPRLFYTFCSRSHAPDVKKPRPISCKKTRVSRASPSPMSVYHRNLAGVNDTLTPQRWCCLPRLEVSLMHTQRLITPHNTTYYPRCTLVVNDSQRTSATVYAVLRSSACTCRCGTGGMTVQRW